MTALRAAGAPGSSGLRRADLEVRGGPGAGWWVGFSCPRSGGRVRANRVRTVQVAALSDVRRRFGEPGAILPSESDAAMASVNVELPAWNVA